MDEVERQTGNEKSSHDQKGKKSLNVHLARALEEAENLFSTPKAGKKRKKTHIEIKRDDRGNRIFHCPRKEGLQSARTKVVGERSGMAYGVGSPPSPMVSCEENCEVEIGYEEQLANILDDCDVLCNDISVAEAGSMSQWHKRTTSSDSNWENWRHQLFSAVLNSYVIPEGDVMCMACGSEPALIKCSLCVSQYLCPDCDDAIHSEKPLHDQQEWLNGFFNYLKAEQSVSKEKEIIVKKRCFPLISESLCKSCGHGQLRKCVSQGEMVILITMKGRYDLHWFSFVCEACNFVQEMSVTSIINEGYWPGSPCQVNYLFDQEVFRVWEIFRMRMPGSSESAFIKALEDISLAKGRVGTVNTSTFRKAAAEWRYCQYELDICQEIRYIDCPPCSMSQHSAHVDGNHKLYRFRNVPRGNRTSYYGDLFIKSNEDVDKQIAEVYSTGKKEVENNTCGDSHWKAAKAVSKSKKKQDETGVEVACCRHSVAQAAVNMFRGEIYGYAHYLHTRYLLPKQVRFIWQDVICLYWPWALSNTPFRFIGALDINPALSVMHGKSHSWNCQFTWGGRWQDGAANTTGEEAEQVNSYISRLGSTTKRMTAAAREEALTEHVLGWNKRKVLNMPKSLRMRYAKTAKTLAEKEKDLHETLAEFGLQEKDTCSTMSEWKKAVEDFARAGGEKQEQYDDFEKYFILFHQIRDATLLKSFLDGGDRPTRDLLGTVDLHCTVQSKTTQLASMQQQLSQLKEKLHHVTEDELLEGGKEKLVLNSILKLQKKAEIIYFSIQRRTRDISKVADRSKLRSSMRKKMSNEKQSLKAVVDKLNTFGVMCGRANISLEQILEGNFPWSEKEKEFDSIPIRTKASVVDKFVGVQRLKEEQDLLIREMINFMAYYRDIVLKKLEAQHHEIKEKIENRMNPDFSCDEEGVPPLELSDVDVKRYENRRESVVPLEGKLAICNSGKWLAKLQLQNGMCHFRGLDNLDLEEFEAENDEEDELRYSGDESSSSESEEIEIEKKLL